MSFIHRIDKRGAAQRVRRGLGVVLLSAIYPLVVLWRVLFVNTDSRLGAVPSDMDGTLRIVQQVSQDGFLTSCSRWNGFPECVGLGLPNRLVRLIFSFLFDLTTAFFSPQLALNLVIFTGWVVTGTAVFLLSRKVGLSTPSSLLALAIVQMLPWIREKSTEHVAYVFVAVPLIVIYSTVFLINAPSKKRFLLSLGLVISTGFFDLYWFYFSLSGLAIALIFIGVVRRRPSNLMQYAPRFRPALFGVTLLTSYLALLVIGQLLTSDGNYVDSGGRQLTPAPADFVSSFSGSVQDFLIPPWFSEKVGVGTFDPGRGSDNIFPIGLTLVIFAIIGFTANRKRLDIQFLGMLSLFYLLLSIGSFKVSLVEVPSLNSIFRYLFPGVRVFLRAGLITEAILCIFAVLGFAHVQKSLSSRWPSILLKIAIIALIVLELQPARLPPINVTGQEFNVMRKILENYPSSAALLTKNSIFQDLRTLNVPLANTQDSRWERTYFPIGAQGERALAEYLETQRVRFVLAEVDQDGDPYFDGTIQDFVLFSAELSSNYFNRIDSPVRSKSNPNRLVQLLEVKWAEKAKDVNVPCTNSGVTFAPQVQVELGMDSRATDDVWWILSSNQRLLPERYGTDSCDDARWLHFQAVPALGEWAEEQSIEIRTRKTTRTVTLPPGEVVTITVPLDEGPIELMSKRPCFVPSEVIPNNSDDRTLCFGLTRFWIDSSAVVN